MAQPEDILRKQLEQVAAEEKLTDYRIEIMPVDIEGAGFMAVNFRAKIILPYRSDINLFAKVAFFSNTMREQFPVDMIYDKEITVYKRVLFAYEQLQTKYAISNDDRVKFPKLYGSNNETVGQCVIMEDLGEQGYTMYERLKPINWTYASKSVEALAKYHALSLAFKKEYPDEYTDIFVGKDEDNFEVMYPLIKPAFMQSAQATYGIVSKDIKEKLEKFLNDEFSKELYAKYYTPTSHGILIHGDYRASNILYKNQDFALIDFQWVRRGSPSIDLIYFIYNGTDEEFRKTYMKQLIDLYYDTFARFLRLLNLDPDEEFSRRDFDEDYKKVQAHGLVTAITVLPIVLMESDNAPKATGDGAKLDSFSSFKGTDSFKKRFTSILNEYINSGLV